MIYRKINCKDRLPKKEGVYDTSSGICDLFKVGGQFSCREDRYRLNINWWLEEVIAPSDEEIEKEWPISNKDSLGINLDRWASIGARWMRNLIFNHE